MLSNNGLCPCAAAQYVLLFLIWFNDSDQFQIYVQVVTGSYSSRPFLCALGGTLGYIHTHVWLALTPWKLGLLSSLWIVHWQKLDKCDAFGPYTVMPYLGYLCRVESTNSLAGTWWRKTVDITDKQPGTWWRKTVDITDKQPGTRQRRKTHETTHMEETVYQRATQAWNPRWWSWIATPGPIYVKLTPILATHELCALQDQLIVTPPGGGKH